MIELVTIKKCRRYWEERLHCGLIKIEYDFHNKKGVAFFPADHVCDMDGVLSLFENLDENVEAVDTYSGNKPDTYYRLYGKWEAFDRP